MKMWDCVVPGENTYCQHQEQSVGPRASWSPGPGQGNLTGTREKEKRHRHQRGGFSVDEAPNSGSLQVFLSHGLLAQTPNNVMSRSVSTTVMSHTIHKGPVHVLNMLSIKTDQKNTLNCESSVLVDQINICISPLLSFCSSWRYLDSFTNFCEWN